MSKLSWKEQLDRKLARAVERKRQKNPLLVPIKVALVGVGNELNGDDGAGNRVAVKLSALSNFPTLFLSINAGNLPENASSVLRRFQPDLVILVDAADFDGEPGEIRWLEAEQIGGMSASTHTLPLSILGRYIETELDCKVEYLGIQPEQLKFDSELSPSVIQAVDEIVRTFTDRMSRD